MCNRDEHPAPEALPPQLCSPGNAASHGPARMPASPQPLFTEQPPRHPGDPKWPTALLLLTPRVSLFLVSLGQSLCV